MRVDGGPSGSEYRLQAVFVFLRLWLGPFPWLTRSSRTRTA